MYVSLSLYLYVCMYIYIYSMLLFVCLVCCLCYRLMLFDPVKRPEYGSSHPAPNLSSLAKPQQFLCAYIYIYIYVLIHVYIYIYITIHLYNIYIYIYICICNSMQCTAPMCSPVRAIFRSLTDSDLTGPRKPLNSDVDVTRLGQIRDLQVFRWPSAYGRVPNNRVCKLSGHQP